MQTKTRTHTLCHCLLVSGLLLLSVSVSAQDKHAQHVPGMSHDGMSHENNTSQDVPSHTTPLEGGQSTFAALIEIVALLEAQPTTDWTTVNIDALREHLLDMDHLMMSTTATTQVVDNNYIEFWVKGTGVALTAIHRMAVAHARFVSQARDWDIETELNSDGAMVRIKANNNAMLRQLKALGFYGFMSLDSHHQAHHLRIATGQGH